MNDLRPEVPGSDSGDYTWQPEYARRIAEFQSYPVNRPVVPPYSGERYDTRTVGQHVEELEQRIRHLEAVVHRYINAEETP